MSVSLLTSCRAHCEVRLKRTLRRAAHTLHSFTSSSPYIHYLLGVIVTRLRNRRPSNIAFQTTLATRSTRSMSNAMVRSKANGRLCNCTTSLRGKTASETVSCSTGTTGSTSQASTASRCLTDTVSTLEPSRFRARLRMLPLPDRTSGRSTSPHVRVCTDYKCSPRAEPTWEIEAAHSSTLPSPTSTPQWSSGELRMCSSHAACRLRSWRNIAIYCT